MKNKNEKKISPSIYLILILIILLLILIVVTFFTFSENKYIYGIILLVMTILFSILSYDFLKNPSKVYYNEREKYFRINNQIININEIEYYQKIKINSAENTYSFKLKNGDSVTFSILAASCEVDNFNYILYSLNIPLAMQQEIKKNFKKPDLKLKNFSFNKRLFLIFFILLAIFPDIFIIKIIIELISEINMSSIYDLTFPFSVSIIIMSIFALFFINLICLFCIIDISKTINSNPKIEYNVASNIIFVGGEKHKISDLSHYKFDGEKFIIYKKDGNSFVFYPAKIEFMQQHYRFLELGITDKPKS